MFENNDQSTNIDLRANMSVFINDLEILIKV